MFKILAAITFLLFLLMLSVTIYPKWFFKSEKKYTRKETLLTTLLLLGLFVNFVNLDIDKNAKSTKSSPSPSVTEPAKPPATVTLSPDEVSKFKDYAKNLEGASFIKSAELIGEDATINYISSYTEYKSLNPNSDVSEDSYNNYWKNGDAINKTLMDIPVRLMRQFSAINKVTVIVPFENKQYSVSLDKTTVEKYFNVSLKDLQVQETWDNQFLNRYENDKEERAKFADKFIKVK